MRRLLVTGPYSCESRSFSSSFNMAGFIIAGVCFASMSVCVCMCVRVHVCMRVYVYVCVCECVCVCVKECA